MILRKKRLYKKSVVFRVDGGMSIGMGHVTRCLYLANALKKMNINCIFIISNKKIVQHIEMYGFTVYQIHKNQKESNFIKNIIRKELSSVFIIDSKRSGLKIILESLPKNLKIVCIDNTKCVDQSDLVIIPNVVDKKNNKKVLGGLEFVIISSKIKSLKPKQKKSTFFLSAGSSDKFNITTKILSAFVESNFQFEMIVIIGMFNKHERDIKNIISNDKRFVIEKNPKDIYQIMSSSMLGIITFGVTVFETAFCKTPVFVIAHNNENEISAKKIEKYGWVKYLGKYDSINYNLLVKSIISYSKDQKLLQSMRKSCEIIDGNGAKRVAKAIINLM